MISDMNGPKVHPQAPDCEGALPGTGRRQSPSTEALADTCGPTALDEVSL